MECTDTDITKFVSFNLDHAVPQVPNCASWFGGSYVKNELESLTGELTIPLANDAQIKLDMSKKADRKFITNIISLIHNVERAIQVHEDLVGSVPTPAELLNGRFDGFKAFQEQYGTDEVVQKGAELLVTVVSKIYDTLQTTYKGLFLASKMPFSSLRFGQCYDFRPKVCFFASRSKRFKIFAIFIRLVNSIHFSLLNQGYFLLFC
ncbi:hypothetical protein HanHA300_Chr15g0574221 [Helianthus annuus]|nr:hypothetical protein HanHA300_Chr15g0574221 [Helianthus annuus]